MSERLKRLREERGNIVASMRALTDKAEAEKRDLSAEELSQHDALFAKVDNLRKQIEAEERQAELERAEASRAAEAAEAEKRKGKGGDDKPATPEERQLAAYRGYLRTGRVSGEGAEELRALQATSDPEGGYLVTPQQVVDALIKAVDDAVWIRARATKFRIPTAAALGVPTLTADPADADWTAELLTGSEDSTMRFGRRQLHPHPLAKRIKISKKLLMMTPSVEALVMGRLGYKFGISQEKAFLTGNGVNQPLGVFTASADGITTARDVSTDNTTTAVTADGLINAKYSVKGQYWPRCDWLFHRDAVKMIAKLKDGDGQYLWRMSIRDGEPDTLLGRPLMVSEYAPNTFTTGLYVGLFGDFSNYWIADAMDMQTQVLNELYAETNQTGIIGRLETDGAPVLAEAFARVKLA